MALTPTSLTRVDDGVTPRKLNPVTTKQTTPATDTAASSGTGSSFVSSAAQGAGTALANAVKNTVNNTRQRVLTGDLGVPGDADAGAGPGSGSGRRSYSGGSASSSYSAPALSYEAPRLPSATSQEEYVNRMYDAYRAQQEADLKAAYEQNLATMNREAERLPETYDQAARQAAVQAEINRQNFNNSALASGLNTGAGSQVRLSQDNAALGNLASIRRAQSNAQADIDFQRAQLETQYKNAIASAVANNDLQRAQALYNEAKRVDDSLVATAINQANLDWSVWNALYNR